MATRYKDLKTALEFKMEVCNAVADFHNVCQSCESYSPVFECCRLDGTFFPKKCARYLHIIGQKRRPMRLDRREIEQLLENKNVDVKQLELF